MITLMCLIPPLPSSTVTRVGLSQKSSSSPTSMSESNTSSEVEASVVSLALSSDPLSFPHHRAIPLPLLKPFSIILFRIKVKSHYIMSEKKNISTWLTFAFHPDEILILHLILPFLFLSFFGLGLCTNNLKFSFFFACFSL